ncbi:hypothetical protein KKH82_05465 [Patescibacteria group bacterium]|nr:hypothetical protein [Patescibacteria group bacterium]
MVKKYPKLYWHPLVILEKKEDREDFKKTCTKNNKSAAKVLGGMIGDYIGKSKNKGKQS